MKNILLFLSLFSFCLAGTSQDLKPTETEMLVNATVTNSKKQVLKNEIFKFIGVKSKKTFTGITGENGKFSLLLPKGDTYNIVFQDMTDTATYSQITIPAKPGKFTSQLSIEVDPAKVYTLQNVLFDTGKSTLKPTSYKALNDLVEVMKLKPSMIIEIGGHTDNTGSKEINLKLSQGRADAVRNYLIQKGILAARITAKGYGDTKPVADNATEEGKAKNRRTEVTVIKE